MGVVLRGEPGRTGSPSVASALLYRPALKTGSERRAGSYRFAFSHLLAPGGKRGPARLLPLLYCHATRIGPRYTLALRGEPGRTGSPPEPVSTVLVAQSGLIRVA